MVDTSSNQNRNGMWEKESSNSNFQNFEFTFNVPSEGNNSTESNIVCRTTLKNLDAHITLIEQDLPTAYAFPNDVSERERLVLQSELLSRLFDGKLFFSPLSRTNPPRYILDIATGLGDWAIQMGDLFPTAEVIATDLSPIQPEEVPPNVNFFVEDSSDPWDYSHKFDFIHTRVTGGCWASFEKQIVQQAFDALEPGGYFESQEVDSTLGCDDGTVNAGGALAQWLDDITRASTQCHRSLITGAIMKEAYERVGFVDVQEMIFKVPTNGWAKDAHLREIGKMWERNLLSGLSGFSLSLFHRVFNMSPEEIEVSLVDVRREISDPGVHAWMPVYVVWGRKPYPGEKV
ncbi:putative methyltransferase tdiE [Metarhizium anisopliae]|nr:putative methyltransferase tdiE [Metarhizium anisopliae]